MLVLYQPRSEHRMDVEEFVRQFKGQYPSTSFQVLDVDQPEGTAKAALYGAMSYPYIIVVRDDGSVIHSWEREIPRPQDVDYYASSNV